LAQFPFPRLFVNLALQPADIQRMIDQQTLEYAVKLIREEANGLKACRPQFRPGMLMAARFLEETLGDVMNNDREAGLLLDAEVERKNKSVYEKYCR
jgi:hypothetical protein